MAIFFTMGNSLDVLLCKVTLCFGVMHALQFTKLEHEIIIINWLELLIGVMGFSFALS